MKLEQQVVSLELAKKLKELNCKQESLFYWCPPNWWIGAKDWELADNMYQSPIPEENNSRISAFTVAELGEMLPTYFFSYRDKDGWWCENSAFGTRIQQDKFSTDEVDSRAKMLIHLIEKGTMKP